MTKTIQVDRFSISLYHGVVAVVFAQGCFTLPYTGKTLPAPVKQPAPAAQVHKLITSAEIKKIASALSRLEEA